MNFRYHCLNCKKLIAESNRQLEVNNICSSCSSCSNSWDKKQIGLYEMNLVIQQKNQMKTTSENMLEKN
jgi:hypothetical protein